MAVSREIDPPAIGAANLHARATDGKIDLDRNDLPPRGREERARSRRDGGCDEIAHASTLENRVRSQPWQRAEAEA